MQFPSLPVDVNTPAPSGALPMLPVAGYAGNPGASGGPRSAIFADVLAGFAATPIELPGQEGPLAPPLGIVAQPADGIPTNGASASDLPAPWGLAASLRAANYIAGPDGSTVDILTVVADTGCNTSSIVAVPAAPQPSEGPGDAGAVEDEVTPSAPERVAESVATADATAMYVAHGMQSRIILPSPQPFVAGSTETATTVDPPAQGDVAAPRAGGIGDPASARAGALGPSRSGALRSTSLKLETLDEIAGQRSPGLRRVRSAGLVEDSVVGTPSGVSSPAVPVQNESSPAIAGAASTVPLDGLMLPSPVPAQVAERDNASGGEPARHAVCAAAVPQATPAYPQAGVATGGNTRSAVDPGATPQLIQFEAAVPDAASTSSLATKLPDPQPALLATATTTADQHVIVSPHPELHAAALPAGRDGPTQADAIAATRAPGALPATPIHGLPQARDDSQPQDGEVAEKSAATAVGAPSNSVSAIIDAVKPAVRPTSKELSKAESALGTATAEPTATMPTGSMLARPNVFHVSPLDTGAAVRADVVQTPVPGALASAAHYAVEAALSATDRLAHSSQQSVNLRFEIDGADLNVRVALRGETVHTTFQTDSAELRTALSTEWQAVVGGSGGERAVKLAAPVFASHDQGAAPFSGDATPRHHDPSAYQSERSVHRRKEANSASGLSHPSGVATSVAAPAVSANSIHLHTLA